MLKKGLVTVVIPIYNVEKYLNRCVNSVISQSYKNLEIILVDDGSPDNCPKMCEDWAQKDSRISVIHKENAGLGLARNTGIENASGEYIYFLDSDDYIALDAIEKCYQLAEEEKADIVTFGVVSVNSSGKIAKVTIPNPGKNIYEGVEVQQVFLPDLLAPNTATGEVTNLRMSAWASFFSMRLINENNWRFVSEREIISEDYFSQLILYKFVRKVVVLQAALNFHCDNADSLTHVYRCDRLEKNKKFYRRSLSLCNQLSYSMEVNKRLAYVFVSNLIGALKLIALANFSRHEERMYMNEILSDTDFRAAILDMELTKERLGRKMLLIAAKHDLYALCRLFVKLRAKV